jgi:hypothetical protein
MPRLVGASPTRAGGPQLGNHLLDDSLMVATRVRPRTGPPVGYGLKVFAELCKPRWEGLVTP